MSVGYRTPLFNNRRFYLDNVAVFRDDEPLTDISETWFSPQLKTVLLSVSESPACGKRTRRLMNIQTTEPDPMLFQVPPDYTVRDDNPHQ